MSCLGGFGRSEWWGGCECETAMVVVVGDVLSWRNVVFKILERVCFSLSSLLLLVNCGLSEASVARMREIGDVDEEWRHGS